METTLIKFDCDKAEVQIGDESSKDVVRELSALELALVGGGAASNSFI